MCVCLHVHVEVQVYMCVCVCVCVKGWVEREGEGVFFRQQSRAGGTCMLIGDLISSYKLQLFLPSAPPGQDCDVEPVNLL